MYFSQIGDGDWERDLQQEFNEINEMVWDLIFGSLVSTFSFDLDFYLFNLGFDFDTDLDFDFD